MLPCVVRSLCASALAIATLIVGAILWQHHVSGTVFHSLDAITHSTGLLPQSEVQPSDSLDEPAPASATNMSEVLLQQNLSGTVFHSFDEPATVGAINRSEVLNDSFDVSKLLVVHCAVKKRERESLAKTTNMFSTNGLSRSKTGTLGLAQNLVHRGAKFINVDMSGFLALGPECCGTYICGKSGHFQLGKSGQRRGGVWVENCSRHIAWVEENIISSCKSCTYVYAMSKGCALVYGTLLSTKNVHRHIILQEHRPPMCVSMINHTKLSLAALSMVSTERSKFLCPSLAHKMLLGGERSTLCSRSDLERHMKLMEQRWRTVGRGKYIVSVGKSKRDHNMVIQALQTIQPRMEFKLLTKGVRGRERCSIETTCSYASAASFETYLEVMEHALAVAIPVGWVGGGFGAGITVLDDALILGKIVIITDIDHLPRGKVKNGTSGFLVRLGNVEDWRFALSYLISANTSVLRDMERSAFSVADAYTWEGAGDSLLSKLSELGE